MTNDDERDSEEESYNAATMHEDDAPTDNDVESEDEADAPTQPEHHNQVARTESGEPVAEGRSVVWRGGERDRGYADTTATLKPLMEASAQDWLGGVEHPHVMLSVPNLGVDHIGVQVKNLTASVRLNAQVLDLLELQVGVDVKIEEVNIDIDNVRVQAMLKIDLDPVVEAVGRVMDTIDRAPEILTNITKGLGEGLAGGEGGDGGRKRLEPLPEPGFLKDDDNDDNDDKEE